MFKKNEFVCEQRAARIIQETESLSYKRALEELGLFNLAKRRQRDGIAVYQLKAETDF